MWASLRTTNPLEQLTSKLRGWTTRLSYFRGRDYLELTIYSYLCYREGPLVPRCLHAEVDIPRFGPDQKPPLLLHSRYLSTQKKSLTPIW